MGGLEWDLIKLQVIEGNKRTEHKLDPRRGGESSCPIEGLFGTGLVILDRATTRKTIVCAVSPRHSHHNLFIQNHLISEVLLNSAMDRDCKQLH